MPKISLCTAPDKDVDVLPMALETVFKRWGIRTLRIPVAEIGHHADDGLEDGKDIYVVAYDYAEPLLKVLEDTGRHKTRKVSVLPYAITKPIDFDRLSYRSSADLKIASLRDVLEVGLEGVGNSALLLAKATKTAPKNFVDDLLTDKSEPFVGQVSLLLLELASERALKRTDPPDPEHLAPDIEKCRTVGEATALMLEGGVELLRRATDRLEAARERFAHRYIIRQLLHSDKSERRYFQNLINEAYEYGATSIEIIRALCRPITAYARDTHKLYDLEERIDHLEIGRKWYQNIIKDDPDILEAHDGQAIWIDPYSGSYKIGNEPDMPLELAASVGIHRMKHFYSRQIGELPYSLPTSLRLLAR